MRCYELEQKEQNNRPAHYDSKATLLILAIFATLLVFGVTLNWVQVAALMVIFLVHEGGHALAMRLFGWKDASVFFIPFMGALLSNQRSRISTWKYAAILMAGPLPGLITGGIYLCFGPTEATNGIDWNDIARMAVMVNAFHLLPLSMLDGGKLMDSSILSSKLWLRRFFYLLGCVSFLVIGVALKQLLFLGFFYCSLYFCLCEGNVNLSVLIKWMTKTREPSSKHCSVN